MEVEAYLTQSLSSPVWTEAGPAAPHFPPLLAVGDSLMGVGADEETTTDMRTKRDSFHSAWPLFPPQILQVVGRHLGT